MRNANDVAEDPGSGCDGRVHFCFYFHTELRERKIRSRAAAAREADACKGRVIPCLTVPSSRTFKERTEPPIFHRRVSSTIRYSFRASADACSRINLDPLSKHLSR